MQDIYVVVLLPAVPAVKTSGRNWYGQACYYQASNCLAVRSGIVLTSFSRTRGKCAKTANTCHPLSLFTRMKTILCESSKHLSANYGLFWHCCSAALSPCARDQKFLGCGTAPVLPLWPGFVATALLAARLKMSSHRFLPLETDTECVPGQRKASDDFVFFAETQNCNVGAPPQSISERSWRELPDRISDSARYRVICAVFVEKTMSPVSPYVVKGGFCPQQKNLRVYPFMGILHTNPYTDIYTYTHTQKA